MTNYITFKSECDQKAKNYQKKYNLKTNPVQEFKGADDEEDAFRHAFASALLVARGDKLAKFLGDMNEKNGPNGSGSGPTSTNMDLWNNAVGREIGAEILKEFGSAKHKMAPDILDDIIAEKIIQRMKKGELITDLKDKRDFENSHHNGRIYTREEIDPKNMNTEEFLRHKIGIDKQLERDKTIPTNAEAAEKAKSGAMVYVQPYTRADGTEVKGYYRSK